MASVIKKAFYVTGSCWCWLHPVTQADWTGLLAELVAVLNLSLFLSFFLFFCNRRSAALSDLQVNL